MTPDFESDLTIQQQAFVESYAVHFDAQRAALEAGYAEKSIRSQAYQLLHNPKIQKAITVALEEHGLENDILKKRLLSQLSEIAFSDVTEFYEKASGESFLLEDLKALPKKKRQLIQEMKVRTSLGKEGEVSTDVTFKLASKEKAIELLARHLGMLVDKTESTNKHLIKVEDDGLWDLKEPGGE